MTNGIMPAIFIGAIDCKEVCILKPSEDHEDYFNRKHFHSVKLQAIVDSNYKYLDVFIGFPGNYTIYLHNTQATQGFLIAGRANDSRCFQMSPIHTKLDNGCLGGKFCIMGDAAYPLKKYLITPFKEYRKLERKQVTFNKSLSKMRQVSITILNTYL